jgi:hypothetical protein
MPLPATAESSHSCLMKLCVKMVDICQFIHIPLRQQFRRQHDEGALRADYLH